MALWKTGSARWAGWLLAAFCFPLVSSAQVSFYGVDTNEVLWRINATTQTAVSIGNTSQFLEGLAFSPTGVLYGTNSGGVLYSLNTSTGAATLIGSTGQGDIEGLHFSGSTLVGISFSTVPTLFSIDTTTGATTNIVTLTSNVAGVPRDLVITGNTALFTVLDSPDTLYSANLTTGAVTLIGSMAVTPGQFLAMDFGSNGILYGFNGDGNVYSINPATAGVTLLGNTGGQFWLDATAVVPEPSTWALMVLGASLLLAVRPWRKRVRV
jgi:hypothetical protein